MNILRRLYLSTTMLLFFGGLSFNQVNATFFNGFSKGNGYKKLTSGKYQLKQLHLAAEASDVEQIEVLIQHGVYVNDMLEDKTALHRAVSSNSMEAAKFLLQNAADPNKFGEHNLLPLCLVLNNVGMAQLLIDYGADVNASAHGYTPLHSAAEHNAYEVAELLIKSGSNVNAQEQSEIMPLHVAAEHNAYEVAKLLIENNADVGALSRGYTPLHIAAKHNAYEVAELLIKSGSNVNAQEQSEIMPLHVAAEHNAYEVAKLLIENDADVNAPGPDYTPLHNAAEHNAYEVAELLIRSGANVNVSAYDYTPLHSAAEHNAYEVAELLIRSGANVNASVGVYSSLYITTYNVCVMIDCDVNAKGPIYMASTPLHVAARHNAYEVAKLLIKNGADVSASSGGYTPLHGAAEYDAYEVAELLIKNGANVNASEEKNNHFTPLHYAVAKKSSKKLIKLLRNSGTEGNWSRIKREAEAFESKPSGCSIM